jgi:hypothetical protein
MCCALLARNRKFESISLQQRVLCEPLFNARQTGIEGRRPINFDEVALPEILDPRRIERQHSPPPVET